MATKITRTQYIIMTMQKYSMALFSHAGEVLYSHSIEAADVFTALTHANHHIWMILNSDEHTAIDSRSRVDVLDDRGSPVARISGAEVLLAMSCSRQCASKPSLKRLDDA